MFPVGTRGRRETGEEEGMYDKARTRDVSGVSQKWPPSFQALQFFASIDINAGLVRPHTP